MNQISPNNKTVKQVVKPKWGPNQRSSKLAYLALIAIMVLLNLFKDVSSAQLPDSPISDLNGTNSLAPVTSGPATLPAGFFQPKDPGDIFRMNDALAERLQTANYPTIIEGKIVMKRDPHPPKFNSKLADSIKALYNSLQIQIQPPMPISSVD